MADFTQQELDDLDSALADSEHLICETGVESEIERDYLERVFRLRSKIWHLMRAQGE